MAKKRTYNHEDNKERPKMLFKNFYQRVSKKEVQSQTVYLKYLYTFKTSGLFVVVSWISFVVPPDIIPGRMALLITLFLVLVNIFNNITTNTPKAEGK